MDRDKLYVWLARGDINETQAADILAEFDRLIREAEDFGRQMGEKVGEIRELKRINADLEKISKAKSKILIENEGRLAKHAALAEAVRKVIACYDQGYNRGCSECRDRLKAALADAEQ